MSQEKLTLIIIAHRLATVKNADRIIVLDNGHVIEEGTFDQLANKERVKFASNS